MVGCSSIRLRALLCAAAVTTLAACSSSAAAELTTAPAVTANGHSYAYAAGSVAKSRWPAVCTLLTTDSAAAAVGAAVTTKAFHHRCYYTPGNDAFPSLTVTILGIGSDQRGTYDEARDNNARFGPRKVADVGRAAVTYPVKGSPTVNLDVLTRHGVFEVALRSPVGLPTGAAQAHAILVKVGKVLATEFRG